MLTIAPTPPSAPDRPVIPATPRDLGAPTDPACPAAPDDPGVPAAPASPAAPVEPGAPYEKIRNTYCLLRMYSKIQADLYSVGLSK